jgi:hypothetical protein
MTTRSDFEALLSDKATSVATDFEHASDVLLVAFGGIVGELGIPVFEFFKLASDLAVKKMFVRDLRQAWYQQGLPGIAEDVDGIARYLEGVVREQHVRRVVMVGNSAGAYAALLFGWLLEVDEVHAFAPQTFVDRWHRLVHWDRRWREEIRGMYRSLNSGTRYLDLAKVLPTKRVRTRSHVYYAAPMRIDRVHARRLAAVPNLELHEYPEGQHNLIKLLRSSGELRRILDDALRIAPVQDEARKVAADDGYAVAR